MDNDSLNLLKNHVNLFKFVFVVHTDFHYFDRFSVLHTLEE